MYYIVWSDWDTSECEEHPNKRSAEERLNKLLCDPNNNGKNWKPTVYSDPNHTTKKRRNN